jgi:hypothetical protein
MMSFHTEIAKITERDLKYVTGELIFHPGRWGLVGGEFSHRDRKDY